MGAKIGAGLGGAAVGGEIGGEIGFVVGSAFGGVGAPRGAILGGIGGAVVGGIGGEKTVNAVFGSGRGNASPELIENLQEDARKMQRIDRDNTSVAPPKF